MSGNDFSDWYNAIPRMTRYWFTGSVIVPLVARFGIFNPRSLVLLFEPLFQKFQIWRPLTGLLYYPISPQTGFSYLINLYFLYSYSSRLESSTFDGCPADYLFMLIFNWLCLVFVAYFANMMMLMDAMVMSVMYIWCQLNRDTIVSFWFGSKFKAMYLPWALIGFNMIIRGAGMMELVGVAVGHLYFFLMFKYPQDFNGVQLLKTPEILYKYFPNRRGGVGGFGQPPTRRDAPADRPAPRVYGRGYRLGDD